MNGIHATGTVVRGHRVASGQGGDPRFPRGTIALQLPLLATACPALAPLLATVFPGTINVLLDGLKLEPTSAPTARDLAWTPHFPPESFFLSRCTLVHAGGEHPAILYRPDPATKPDHHQPAGLVELLAATVPDVRYGDPVELRFDPADVRLTPAA